MATLMGLTPKEVGLEIQSRVQVAMAGSDLASVYYPVPGKPAVNPTLLVYTDLIDMDYRFGEQVITTTFLGELMVDVMKDGTTVPQNVGMIDDLTMVVIDMFDPSLNRDNCLLSGKVDDLKVVRAKLRVGFTYGGKNMIGSRLTFSCIHRRTLME